MYQGCVGVAPLFGIGTKAKNPNNNSRFLTVSRINKNATTLQFTLNQYKSSS
jgi:hypothetical protein